VSYLLIGFLVIVAAFLGKAWNDAREENSGLRAQVAALKKKLARSRGA
jgi:hypothetical protein